MQRKPATDKHTQSNVCLILHKVVHIKLQLKIESWENKFDDLLNVHRKIKKIRALYTTNWRILF